MNQFEKETTMWTLEKCINELDSLDELDQVYNIVKDKRRRLSLNNKYKLIVGQEVSITGSNNIQSGKIVKINRTRAVVDCFDKKKRLYDTLYSSFFNDT